MSLLSLVAVIAVISFVATPLLQHSSGRLKSKPIVMAALFMMAVGAALVCWAAGLV